VISCGLTSGPDMAVNGNAGLVLPGPGSGFGRTAGTAAGLR
jgi:hypothetical protein